MNVPVSNAFVLHGAELDAGRDLAGAVERSVGRLASRKDVRRTGPANTGRLPSFRESLSGFAGMSVGSCAVRGQHATTGDTVTALFRGRLASVDFVAEHLFGTTEFERVAARSIRSFDYLVLDHPLLGVGRRRRNRGLMLPGWLRQRSVLGAEWARTVAEFSPSLRKKISRALGNRSCVATVSADSEAKRQFFRDMYLPYVEHRFGSAAVVWPEAAFLRSADAGVLLQLEIDGMLECAVLVSAKQPTLFVQKSAYRLGTADSLRSDLLDYFCMQLAQLLRCEYVDWGLSRPHLDDGVFVNKSKWRPQLVLGDGWLKSIQIVPLSDSASTRALLRRNGFIERRRGQFVVRRLAEQVEPPTEADLAGLAPIVERAAIDRLIVAYAGPDPQSMARIATADRIELVTLATGPKLQNRFLRATQ
jgi:hypothetical protein